VYVFFVYTEKTKNCVFTKKAYDPATENSPLFAVDCEMVSMMSSCGEFSCIFCLHCTFFVELYRCCYSPDYVIQMSSVFRGDGEKRKSLEKDFFANWMPFLSAAS